ncbi:MAG TPA: hemolysin family protein [Baekduia sp.]|nr:hemolysin family protein [Baekduia sp.]
MSDALRVLGVLALVAGNAFFVIGEYAIVTARRGVLARRADSGRPGARVALRLMDNPVRVISTVQVGITAIGILTGAIGEPLVRDILGDGIPSWLAFVIAFAVVTYLSVVLGELVPKALTLDRAETLAALVAPAISALSVVLRPVVAVLEGSARLLLRPFGVRTVIAGDSIRSPEELRAVIDEAETAGVIPAAQEELLHNVFDFAGREAGDVMVPASDVDWLDAGLTASEAVDIALARHRSRHPVGTGSLDHLVGVVHLQELMRLSRSQPGATIESCAQPALVVPETKDLGALLRELREARQQLAVIADEYGGTAGIVTMEDIVEQIVGEIEDEFHLPDDTLAWVGDRAVVVAGSMTIDDFNEAVDTHLPQDGVRTMAGLLFHTLGRRPEVGDAVEVAAARLVVEELDGVRITRLRVELPAAR